MTDNTITLIPPGKLRCIITDKLRSDTPEENVRQRIARSLIDDYGYKRADLEVEFPVNMGRSKKRADIAIFPPETKHKQENIKIIVECKHDGVRPTDRDNGIEQLKSYLSACLKARFGLWIGSELQVWEKVKTKGGEFDYVLATDIPRFGFDAPRPLTFSDLVPAHEELIGAFKRCHNYIYGNQGLQKDLAFQELLKLIFCKVYDEDTSGDTMRFFIGNEERRSEIGQRRLRNTIDQLFDDVKSYYTYIFAPDEQIRLENRVLSYVVGELQRFSLLQTEADVKGAAYEQLVGSNLRGDRGEFFTPRNVCEMAARMIFATFPQDKLTKLRVLDPACGTGGFLVAVMNVWREYLYERQWKRWHDETKAHEETKRLLKEHANSYLMGVDFNPILVRAAQMNLVMHGDGSTNVFHANSLLPPGEWPSEPPNDVAHHIKPNKFDVILTNPPFGSHISIDDPHIIEQFDLARFEMERNQRRASKSRRGERLFAIEPESELSRTSMAPDRLFIERCLYLLRPGGRLAIVLPDSVLSNPGLSFIRRWILQRARVLASIDLPPVTFEPYTGVHTSLLLLQKKTPDEIRAEQEMGRPRDYEVFMAMPNAVGHDRRGEPLHLRTPEGELIEYEDKKLVYRREVNGEKIVEQRRHTRKAIHDELPEVVRYFSAWAQQPDRMRWLNG